ncbi:hypothetical protein KC343_g223 [Hortaea werneckii]|nr:hypothetical protein KC361_g8909 [Hortaea werneckii]KAI6819662.1 hypothetical protein KC342_g13940 [Hortaea werneckii]KAI6851118.1 hypothetical protein KC350_g1757 [Hortaea werneckii]KAI6854126.1 hypothetical protein KC323_g8963 [Hortaea werneckii]KAI6855522.1 hypothetical protein KC338_g8855 [Hortaea werneckii]
MEVISPTQIPITFIDIGGLDPIIADLRETVIYSINLSHLAAFLSLHISTLAEKQDSVSYKVVSAMFSLASKMQPAVVFIDEIDDMASMGPLV